MLIVSPQVPWIWVWGLGTIGLDKRAYNNFLRHKIYQVSKTFERESRVKHDLVVYLDYKMLKPFQ